MWKKMIAESIGTFALVFFGTGAIIVNQQSGSAVMHPGIAVTFGLVVMTMIYTFGAISGAHINPAVTLAFSSTDRFERRLTLPYLGAQVVGALTASFMLAFLFPASSTLGATLPVDSPIQSFTLELLLTFFLMLVILFSSQGSPEIRPFAAIAIGGTVLMEALFAGPICGASMNPARSLAPAIVSGHFEHLWIYLTAPVAGAWLAALVWRNMK
ncbi:MAG: aquaporin [Saprospiraceae bacterium]